jgi:ATP-dependent RNA helicase DDX21
MVAASDDHIAVKKSKKVKCKAAIESFSNADAVKKIKKEKTKKSDTSEKESKKRKRKTDDAANDADAEKAGKEKKKEKKKKQKVERAEPSTAASDSAESEQFVEVSTCKPADPLALDNFRLSDSIKSLLREKNIEALFNIQAQTLNLVLDGFDLVGRAR